jgi:hypothetical protein
MPRLSKIGAAALAAFGWTGISSVSASYLVVAGGGGGGDVGDLGGGGGAGGYLTGTSLLNLTLSYTVTVGAGGSPDVNGSNSVFNSITSIGGGKGGTNAGTLPSAVGGSGGGGGATSGSGDYLVTLPNSLQFDTTLASQITFTGNIGANVWDTASYIIPSGSGVINNNNVGGQVYPVIYNSTKFRILTLTYGSAVQCWGSGYYQLAANNPKVQLTFQFTSL